MLRKTLRACALVSSRRRRVSRRSLVLAAILSALPAYARAQTTITVTTAVDCTGCGSLRDAINVANSLDPSTGITVDLSGLSGTISLVSPLPTITSGFTMLGPSAGITLTGAPTAVTVNLATAPQLTFRNILLEQTGANVQAGNVTVATAGFLTPTGSLTNSAGTVTFLSAAQQGLVQNHASLIFNEPGGQAVFGGTISGSGSVMKTGVGELHFTTPHSYTGGTTVQEGQLHLQGSNLLYSQGALSLIAGSGVPSVSVVSYGDQEVGDLSGLRAGFYFSGFRTLTVNTTGFATFSGALAGAGSVLNHPPAPDVVKRGSGTWRVDNETINRLVIEEGTVQSSGLSASVVANNGVLHLLPIITSSQFSAGGTSASISGTGSVIIEIRPGRFGRMLGTNTYTGGTTVSGGVLYGTTRTLQGDFVVNADAQLRFDVDASFMPSYDPDGTHTGVISGDGSLVKAASDVLTLAGTNSYRGGTHILSGTLRGTTDSVQGDVLNHSVLDFRQDYDGTFRGTVTGEGVILVTGTGIVRFSGAQFHTGGTEIRSGTLEGDSSTLTGAIVNHGTLQFAQDVDGTVGASITGTGRVVKTGTGTLFANLAMHHTGGTTFGGGVFVAANDAALGGSGGGVMFDGGTLRFGTAFSSDRAVSLASTGSIDTNAFDIELSGPMTGAGGFTKVGSGTLLLTGANSYTGGTTVSAGTLSGTTSAIQGNVLNNGQVSFNQASGGTYAGSMSGSGALIKTGTGTVWMTGSNSYTGGTFVLGGTLAGDTTSLTGAIVNDATLEFAQNGAGSFSGVVSGSGRVVKTGAGTLMLDGANSYGGGTIFGGGIVRAAGDASLGQASGGLTFDGGALQFGGTFVSNRAIAFLSAGTIDTNGFSGVLSGDLTGAGDFTKTGTGTLFLTGSASHTGGTTISQGVLSGSTRNLHGRIVNNALVVFEQDAHGTFSGAMSGAGAVLKLGRGILTFSGAQAYTGLTDVGAGGLLLGGSLAGSLAVRDGALLKLASQPITVSEAGGGAIRIAGDLFLARGSTYEASLDTAGKVTTLDVGATAAIDGAWLQIAPGFADAIRVATSVVIRAQTIDGGFAAVTGIDGTYEAYLIPRGGELLLHLVSSSIDFAAFAASANGASLASALGPLQAGASSDLAAVLRELRAMATDEELGAALDQMAGSDHASITGSALLSSAEISDVIGFRFLGRAGPWVQAVGSSLSLDENVDPASATSKTYGTLGGYDWKAGNDVRLGLAAGYGRGELRAFNRSNDVTVNTYRGAVYGETGVRALVFSGIFSAAHHRVEGGRSLSFAARMRPEFGGGVLFGGIDRSASFAYNELELAGTIETGLRMTAGGVTLRPSAGIQIARLTRRAFDENGAGALNLSFGEQSLSSETVRVRLSAERTFGWITPRVDVRYAHELGSRDVVLDARMSTAPFELAALRLPRESLAARVGVVMYAGRVSFSADYRFGAAVGQHQHLVSFGVGR